MEVYVDDMLVKTKKAEELTGDLGEMFNTLWMYRMKLNLLKCIFRVSSGFFWTSWLTPEALRPTLTKLKP